MEASVTGFSYRLGFDRFWYHPMKQVFKCHGMSTTMMRYEELAIAVICAIIESDMMIIIVPVKSKIKFIEAKTGSILSVSFCFFQLADQSVVHRV